MRTGAERAPRRPRLAGDGARYGLAMAITAVFGVGHGVVVNAVSPGQVDSLTSVATRYFGAWAVYSIAYIALTVWVLRPADGATLRTWLTEDKARRRRRRAAERVAASGGPFGAVSFCAVAIGAVVAAAVVPALRDNVTVMILAIVVVVTSWLLIVVVFAVHYAREDARVRGFTFPGTDEHDLPRFSDYCYLAVQVSTAFNGADVTVTKRELRRALTAHALVAFVYNTVLIALLVSLLIAINT
ncbi:DUF1345 domain-containing protein [Actinomadura flavalba]|uniref:DUF1345 domain-containing protein n=1 Tax=Actinomadura flavalba TaxID=1120938 RepID=UPI00036F7F5E|nr:DUF1345 domain-containing protein [Actinomadura flavalba]